MFLTYSRKCTLSKLQFLACTFLHYFPYRLKSQCGAFQIFKASIGGNGIRDFVPLNCSTSGYTVQRMKDEVCTAKCFVIPLNSDMDITPVTVNDITLESPLDDEPTCVCSSCGLDINLTNFRQHKATCREKGEGLRNISGIMYNFFVVTQTY